ncbi:MAG: hypothetical protein FP814_01585 [Desulfobacterium sp.]|nr:hypothetical protein [Desulfobacterium sp.]MBU3950378.1 sirohydrochlorin cobaltochelatase [Pseudomonadota bacterium]MBU4009763.1 sirohydrochlorin cobaltochelatase [Pseudomonadota bacterium]MBU4035682.1 sirohydrochlorin cobaltochelatase [Pseudomonadota bacterium]
MKTPIVMTAFGTTTKALETYDFMNEKLAARFKDHEILWAYSSRMVKDWIKKRRNIDLKHPHEILTRLSSEGHLWAVVQSLHLFCGHEFYRMVQEAENCKIRTSIGLPLLTEPEDYELMSENCRNSFNGNNEEAVVLVGHGTDHPVWSSYLALQHMLQKKIGRKIYIGVVEGFPERSEIIDRVKDSGFKKVRLIPFMLVAGTHFQEDLIGEEDSWKTAFEQEGICVTADANGLGMNENIINLFIRHIEDALRVIPDMMPERI